MLAPVHSQAKHRRVLCYGRLQVQNVARASRASLEADMATLQAKIGHLQGELASVLGEFQGLQDEAQLIEGVVVDEVRPHRCALRDAHTYLSGVAQSPGPGSVELSRTQPGT